MQVTETHFDASMLRGPTPITGDGTRSGGLHLSQIYGDLDRTITTKQYAPMSEEQRDAYRAVGFVWEHVVAKAMVEGLVSDLYLRPGEFELDGITGSPDLIYLPDWRVVDTKATYKSSRQVDDLLKNFRVWMWQMKGYCHMIESRSSQLIICFMAGDYRNGQRPEFRQFDFEWTTEELKENWAMLTGHAKKRGWK